MLELAELGAHLRSQRMAAFKLPERLEIFDELPKTVTGKVSKDAVRERVLQRSVGDHAAIG
jgi:cyclohexanecarboxylate-CoA ligase